MDGKHVVEPEEMSGRVLGIIGVYGMRRPLDPGPEAPQTTAKDALALAPADGDADERAQAERTADAA